MKHISIIVTFIFLLVISASCKKDKVVETPIATQQEIPLNILESGHLLLAVKANDTVQGNFVLDTGGGIEVVSSNFFNKIKTNAKKIGLFTGFRNNGERLDVMTYKISNIKIGNTTKSDVIVGVYPALDKMGIDGLISCKFFEDTPFTIDYKNQKLYIENEETLKNINKNGTEIPIFLQKHGRNGLDLFIDVTLNDKVNLFSEFDTGHGYYPMLVNSFYNNESKKDTIISSKLNLKIAKNIHLTTDVSFKNNLIYQGLIGSDIFKNGKLTIDIKNEKMIYRE